LTLIAATRFSPDLNEIHATEDMRVETQNRSFLDMSGGQWLAIREGRSRHGSKSQHDESELPDHLTPPSQTWLPSMWYLWREIEEP